MHTLSKIPRLFLLLLLPFLFLMGCEKDNNSTIIKGTNSIVDYLAKTPDFSLFSEAISRAGLSGTLDGNVGTYTVLAPDNVAMEAYLQEEGVDSLGQLPDDQIKRLVKYHVLETLTPSDNFVTGYVKTLASLPVNDSISTKLSLYVNADNGVEFNGVSTITEGDIPIDNGLLHRISAVIPLPTIKTFMTADANLTAFYDRLTAAGIATDFSALLGNPDKQTTIFVPNENAVSSFFAGEGSTMSPSELNRIYNYHLLDTAALSTNFVTGYRTTKAMEDYSGNAYPLSIYVNTLAGIMLNDGTSIVIPDITTINGNIQVINHVLTLPTVKTFIMADSRFGTLDSLMTRADQIPQDYMGLVDETLGQGHAPFTVFAPDNAAFDELLTELFPNQNVDFGAISTDSLTDILNLHIIEHLGLRGADFSDQSLNTLGGIIQLNAADTTLTDPAGRKSPVLPADIQATNGVVHAIKKVLLPN